MQNNLTIFAEKGDVSSVRRLLAEGVPVDAIENGRFNVTPLLVAARGGHLEVVRLLLTSGANINFIDNDFFSPVTAAARAGKWTVVRALAEMGGDFTVRDGYGKSGFDYLQRCRSKRIRTGIAALLAQQRSAAEQSHALDPAAGLDSNGQSSLPAQ